MAKKRQDPAAGLQEAPVDAGLDFRVSAAPGPDFIPGTGFKIPAPVVTGLRQMLTRLTGSRQWPQVVAMTAALREEGVSYTALAVSTVLNHDTAQSVCLVDANWYWPSVPILNSPGLAGVVAGTTALGWALVRVNAGNPFPHGQGNLVFLPAGPMPAYHRATAARSAELRATVDELRRHFTYVILDLPPILATSDAIALAGVADASCLVVRQGVTPITTIHEALNLIGHLPVMGLIMNSVRVHMPAGLAGQFIHGWAQG